MKCKVVHFIWLTLHDFLLLIRCRHGEIIRGNLDKELKEREREREMVRYIK
ncbi:unnamed protein product [Musa acuminata subsp. burmannicoides]